VAGHTLLIDQQQHGVAVAIQAQLVQMLDLPGCLPLAPKSVARARPVASAALGQRRAHRVAVHPSHHQDLAGVVLLNNRRHEAVGLELDLRQRALDGIGHLDTSTIRQVTSSGGGHCP
jgi:hypothetical protein